MSNAEGEKPGSLLWTGVGLSLGFLFLRGPMEARAEKPQPQDETPQHIEVSTNQCDVVAQPGDTITSLAMDCFPTATGSVLQAAIDQAIDDNGGTDRIDVGDHIEIEVTP